MKKVICIIVVCILGSIGTVCAQEMTIVTTESYPYSYKEDGEIKGISTEVVRAVLEEAGVEAEIKVYPWARAYALAQDDPNVLIYLIERLPDRENLFHWIGQITPLTTYVYKLKSRTDIEIHGVKDLMPYKVGVIREGGAHNYLAMRRIPELHLATMLEQNIKMLKKKRLDVLVAYELEFLAMVKSLDFDLEQFEKTYRIDELSVHGYLAMSLGTPEETMYQFQDAMYRVITSGTYKEILHKYLAE